MTTGTRPTEGSDHAESGSVDHPEGETRSASSGTGPDRAALRSGAIVGAIVAAGTAAIVAVDPSDSGVPICWSQGVFGIDCPLCGGLRCVNSLARGDWVAAADHNVVLAVLLPLAVLGWVAWMVAAWRGRRLQWPPALRSGPLPKVLIAGAIVAVLAFTVARNLDTNAVTLYLGSTSG